MLKETLMYPSPCTAVPELPFLELGATPGVDHILLPAEDEAVSEAISVPGGLPIFGYSYSEVYVSVHLAMHWSNDLQTLL